MYQSTAIRELFDTLNSEEQFIALYNLIDSVSKSMNDLGLTLDECGDKHSARLMDGSIVKFVTSSDSEDGLQVVDLMDYDENANEFEF